MTIKPHATALALRANWLKLSFWKHSACAYNNLRICKRPRLRELGHGSCTCTDAEGLCGLRLLAARSSVGTSDCWLRMASMSPASADRCLRRVPAATAAPTAATPRAPFTLSHAKQHLYTQCFQLSRLMPPIQAEALHCKALMSHKRGQPPTSVRPQTSVTSCVCAKGLQEKLLGQGSEGPSQSSVSVSDKCYSGS